MLRGRGLILANADGLDQPHVFRSVPSIVNSRFTAPYGWSGEFPTLQKFALGAVEQHFTKTMLRRPGIDFRVPTQEELDALAAFMASITSGIDTAIIHNPTEETLAPLLDTDEERLGLTLFFGKGKCFNCHSGPALAYTDPNGVFGGKPPFFDTRGKGPDGINVLPINQVDNLPLDDGNGTGQFNTAALIGFRYGNMAFFHDNAIRGTLEDEIEAYTKDVFGNSSPGLKLNGIDLNDTEVDAIAAFLRAINEP